MSIIGGILERRQSLEDKTTVLSGAAILEAWTGPRTATGKRISEEGALRIGTVYACVRVLAESIASLPWKVYARSGDGKREAPDHPLYPLLHDAPNPWMTSFSLRETLMGHVLLWGNAFAEIMRDGSGGVAGLFPLRPDHMKRPVVSAAGGLLYTYRLPDGSERTLPQTNILHIRGLSCDGIWGYSPIALQREALGLASTAEEFQGRFFANAAQPSGILTTEGTITPEGADRLKQEWQAKNAGLDNAHRVAVLEQGLKWQQIGMPLQDAQFLELRKYQRSEIAGWFLVPPHKIGDLERATFTNIEQQSISFVVDTLRAWLVRIEQQANRDLLTETERRQFFTEFSVDALLRGDSAARGAFYQSLFQVGALSPNQALAFENMNPVPGGDERFVPMNMVPLSMAQALAEKQAAPNPAPAAPKAPVDDEQNALDADLETRSVRGRLRLRETFRPLFKHLGEQLVDAEAAAIRKDGLDRLNQRTADSFLAWLESYHADDLGPLAEKLSLPLLHAYAAAVTREIAAELGVPNLEPDAAYAELVARGFAETYTAKSRATLRRTIREAERVGIDPAVALRKAVDHWLDTRPGAIADGESVRAGESFAVSAYRQANVGKLRWTATGRKNCPYCARLVGRVVNAGDHFLDKGGQIDVPGQKYPLRTKRGIKGPPLHRTCNCVLRPA